MITALVGPSVHNDLQELKNTGGKLLSSGARERLGQVFLVEREQKKKSMHLLTHYAELVGEGSICSIEYILHQTLTLKPKLFSNCSYNQQQVRRITNDTNGRQRGLEAEKPREIWVGRGGSGGVWGGGRAEDCKEEENP